MYGHTKTMKDMTELFEAVRGLIGVEAQGGYARNPPPCSKPRNWFRPIKLLSDMGVLRASDAIRDEATHILTEIDSQVTKLLTDFLVPKSIWLGGWEMVVVETWLKATHTTVHLGNKNPVTVSLKTEETKKTARTEPKMYMHVVSAELLVKESDVESTIEVMHQLRF